MVIVGATGVELVAHGVLPGTSLLDRIDGACDVPSVALDDREVGESVPGAFYSQARRRVVGYTVGYPTGRARGPSWHSSSCSTAKAPTTPTPARA